MSWWTASPCVTSWTSGGGFGRLPLTLDAVDVLLSKLQIVELNEKDARDIFQLLAGLPLSGGDGAPTGQPALDTVRFGQVVAADWGWWRTVTGSLDKLPDLAAEKPELVPPAGRRTRSPRRSSSPRSRNPCRRA